MASEWPRRAAGGTALHRMSFQSTNSAVLGLDLSAYSFTHFSVTLRGSGYTRSQLKPCVQLEEAYINIIQEILVVFNGPTRLESSFLCTVFKNSSASQIQTLIVAVDGYDADYYVDGP